MPLTKPNPAASFIGPPPKPCLKPSPVPTPARRPSPSPERRTVSMSGDESSSSSGGSASNKHAHFPPPGQEPTARYSGLDYDRTPIVVLPNACALPPKGCPGKTYFQVEDDERSIASSASAATITPLTSNHAHPSKLVKKQHRAATSAPGTTVLVHHSDTNSSDYDSDENDAHSYQRVAVVFPPGNGSNSPTTMFSTERMAVNLGLGERDRKMSSSSARTITAATSRTKARTSAPTSSSMLTVGTGRSAWSSTSESSEDDCLGGF